MAAKKAAKKKLTKKTTPRQGVARTPAAKATPEPSQERRELERAIMQPFALERIPLEESIAHRPSDIAVIAAVLAGGKGATPDDNCIESAIDLWNSCTSALARRERERHRRNAVQKLLFTKGETKISRGEFLRKLLPDDLVKKRNEYMKEGLRRMPETFAELFQVGGRGWPTEHLATVLETEPGPAGDGIMKHYLQITEDGVTLDHACGIAPYVLAWRNLVCSPQVRGSMRQRKAEEPAGDSSERLSDPSNDSYVLSSESPVPPSKLSSEETSPDIPDAAIEAAPASSEPPRKNISFRSKEHRNRA